MVCYGISERKGALYRKKEGRYLRCFFILSILAHLSTGLFQALR